MLILQRRHLQEAEDDKRLAGCGREEYYANQPTTIMQQYYCCGNVVQDCTDPNDSTMLQAVGTDGWMDMQWAKLSCTLL